MSTIYRLRIDAYSPATIPMARLASYMQGFASLMGYDKSVHFETVETGSTQLVARVDFEDVPKVRERLVAAARGEAPKEVRKAFDDLDRLMADDNAAGSLYEDGEARPTGEIIRFPGRDRPKPKTYGPFNQRGSLDGLLVSIGGTDQTISLQLLNGSIKYTGCETRDRSLARKLGHHLFEPIRIHGSGRWLREEDGNWTLRNFKVESFEALESGDLRDVIESLRKAPGARPSPEEARRTLEELRDDEASQH
ncbi:MAG: hypothetical protein WD100_05885 [Tistlia sp.]|uniref:hypothetical protein n=1 Tax=Tistlia sp. TaxID=3057121 RepID=UPI0034A17624